MILIKNDGSVILGSTRVIDLLINSRYGRFDYLPPIASFYKFETLGM
jgi:hypothetical protein